MHPSRPSVSLFSRHARDMWVGLAAAIVFAAAVPVAVGSTWSPLLRAAPGRINIMLLLSDGTVMGLAIASNSGNTWYRLTPDSHGSYINGTWSSMPPMHSTRLYFSSAVLKDGRVFVAGGEYGTGGATSEVFDPVANTWTQITVPTSLLDPAQASPFVFENQGFYDSCAKIIASGDVIITPVAPRTGGQTIIFRAQSNTFVAGPAILHGTQQDEASWVKLADQTILTVDPNSQTSERYNPATNSWINDATLPVALYDSALHEIGAAVRLADGRALILGATGHTALYIPSGSATPGSWVGGPDIPLGLTTPDAPACVLANGRVLCAAGPAGYIDQATQAPVYPTPTSFFEFDPIAGAFTRINGPTGLTDSPPPYAGCMLALPDGNVLYSHFGADLYVYQPDGPALAAAKPTITGVSVNPDGSYHLDGLGLNGISEGAAYGDDAQMDTNYPLVRFVGASGIVYYARTFNWSSTAVATGSLPVSTEFRLPISLPPGAMSLYAVANGVASDPIPFQSPGTIQITGTGQYTIDDSAGNGNGRIEPGEPAIGVSVFLVNPGTVTAVGVHAELASSTPTVSVVTGGADYPNLAPAVPASNTTPFVFSVDPSHPCGAPIDLTLTITSSGPTATYHLTLPTGLAGAVNSPVTITYSGSPVAIPDGSPAGVSIPLQVSGLAGTMTEVRFRLNGTACTPNAGATTVGLDHTWVGDITLRLVSPSGTSVTLMDHPGSAGNNGHNFCSTLLLDQAPGSIQAVTPTGNPYSGSFTPATPLAALAGENPNGTWHLLAFDNFQTDSGSVRAFSIIITTRQPSACDPPTHCEHVAFSGGAMDQTACRLSPTSLSISPTGTGPFSYQWRKGGATISGATGQTYTIQATTDADAGLYDCLVSNSCSSLASPAITLSVCRADFNCTGTVNVQDVFDFLSAWFAGDPRANFHAGTSLIVQDVFTFLGAWFNGC